MRRALVAAAVTAATAGTAVPAGAVGVCDPGRDVCVYVDDPRDQCPAGYSTLVRLPHPNGGVFLLVCLGKIAA